MVRPTLLSRSCVDRRDGSGTQSFLLKQWPVTSIESVTVSGAVLPAATTDINQGWRCNLWDGTGPGSPTTVELGGGYSFTQGSMNVEVAYTAGYPILLEPHVIPATPFLVVVDGPKGPWAGNLAVTTAAGDPMTLVTGTPTTGQYALGTLAGTYQFAAADTLDSVLISYSYTPWDINLVATEWVAERYSYKDRIGQRSKSLGGQETISWDLDGIPAYVRDAIRPYVSVIQLL